MSTLRSRPNGTLMIHAGNCVCLVYACETIAEHDGTGDCQKVRASQLGANREPPMVGSLFVRNVPHHPACGMTAAARTFHASSATTSDRAAAVRRNAGCRHHSPG